MTVSTSTNRISYTGDGVSTVFAVPFIFLANSDIAVYVDGVEVTTGFVTTGAGVGTGNVTFTVAPAALAAIVLVRDPDFLQQTALPSNGPFPSESVEDMADKSMIGLQRFLDLLGRSLILADGDSAADMTLPLLADRASMYLGFDANGLPVATAGTTSIPLVSAFMATVLDDANATAALTTLGSGVIGRQLFAATTPALGRLFLGSGAIGDPLFLSTTAAAARAILQVGIRSSVSGLVPSTAGGSTSFAISAGETIDSVGTSLITLAAAITKTTGAWAVGSGNGGLDTGAIANSTWYYFYPIQRTDTNVVDVVFSLSSSAPSMPASYTLKSNKPVAAGLTNGSAQWTSFTAIETAGGGLDYVWAAPPLDLNTAVLTTTRLLTTLTVPVLAVTANLSCNASNAGACQIKIQCPDETDAAPTTVASPGVDAVLAAGVGAGIPKIVRTDSSGRVASRSTAASTTLRIVTNGFSWSRR